MSERVPLYNLHETIDRESLIDNEDFLEDASYFLMDRAGYEIDDLSTPEDVYAGFMEHFRYQNVNEVTALKDLDYAQDTDVKGKERFGRLMDTYDNMDSDLGWAATGDYLGGVLLAPSTYAGIFTGGGAKAGAFAAQQGVKLGIKQAIKSGLKREGLQGLAVESLGAAATVTAQEAARVESGIQEEMDYTNIGLSTGLSAVVGGGLGTAVGTKKFKTGFKSEQMVMAASKVMDDATEKAHSTATKQIFNDERTSSLAKEYSEILYEDADEVAKEGGKKLSLKKTIPNELEEGGKLRAEFGSIEAKEIENIAAAASRIDHLIPDLPDLPKGKVERFASRFARALNAGLIQPEELQKVLNDHNVTVEQLGPIFAAELSRSGQILGTFGAAIKKGKLAKQAYRNTIVELNKLDDEMRQFGGSITHKARQQLDKQRSAIGFSRTANVINHINKARIGFMTIQPATTIRNTTNGYLRNYVYMFDNLGAGLANLAKGSVQRLVSPTDSMLRKEGERATRMGVAQLKTAGQSFLFKDMILGMESVESQALFKLLNTSKFGRTEVNDKLLRNMGDIGNLTGTEGGLIGAARILNTLNTMSDNMFKRAIFSRELDKAIKANPIKAVDDEGNDILISNLNDVITTGNLNKVDDIEFAQAMEEAFDFTYQTGNFRSREGGFNQAADMFIKFGQSTAGSTVVPFPRYLVNQFRFAYEHAPILGMINSFGILNKPKKIVKQGEVSVDIGKKGLVDLSPEQMGKQLGGLAMLGTFMSLRANLGDENTGPYEYKVGGDIFNAKAAIGPFSGYALVADYLYRKNFFNWHTNDKVSDVLPFTSREFIEAFAGGNMRAGTSLDIIEGMVEIATNGVDAGDSWVSSQDAIAKYLGNVASTFLVGAGVYKDVVAQYNPEYRQLSDKTSINFLEYFFKQAGRSLPQEFTEDSIPLASPTRSTGVRTVNPLIKQFTGMTQIEDRTVVEDELKRLQFDYAEIAPYRIVGDKPLSNESKQFMGEFVEREIFSFINSPDYKSLPSDVQKRFRLKKEINMFRTLSRNLALDPERATTKEQFYNIMRAKYLNLSKGQKRVLNDRYKTEFPELFKNGILEDAAFWMMDY